MQHQGIEAVLECLLNRGLGNEDDTKWFAGVRHDDLIKALLDYLNAHRHFLGYCHIDGRQALNDRGVDAVISASGFKAGFQIKSHVDVAEPKFAANVKRQFAEALSYGLDHYYLLICSPLSDENKDFRMKIAHLLNEVALYQNIVFDAYGPLNTVTVLKHPPTVSRDELLIRKAISNDCLHEYEKGYEHLPEVDDFEIRAAEEILDEFGEDWWDSKAGAEAFEKLQKLVHQKQAEQFTSIFTPTLPPEIIQQRFSLIVEIENLLSQCRHSEHWNDHSEYKLPSWLDHVPEEMIPYTSIPNLLRIRESIAEFLARHLNTPQSTNSDNL
ncbi:MAG: hypothetical protein HUJ26_04420 [Planctomycetaceae bacterium]|nr:hypothetical protein [Planctomycetaceae bacterium]